LESGSRVKELRALIEERRRAVKIRKEKVQELEFERNLKKKAVKDMKELLETR
jgi:16S rRNA G966 N2-methylase RsmD